MSTTEVAGLAELVAGMELRAAAAEQAAKAAGVSDVYAALLAGRERLDPERSALDPLALLSTALELAERQLADVEAGRDEFAPWAYRLMQETVPALRMLAGLEGPDQRETEIRARFGVPAPGGAAL